MARGNAKECGAKTRTGAPCKAAAMPNGRCRLHGGKSPGGIASATFKTGLYSRYLPTRLKGAYEEGLANPKLLELKEQVALVDARIVEQLQRLNTGEHDAAWKLLKETFTVLKTSYLNGDADKVPGAIRAMEQIISDGEKDVEAWAGIYESVDLRRRLAESERKALVQSEQMMAVSEVMLMVGAILAGVKEHVKDRQALAAINGHVAKIISIEP